MYGLITVNNVFIQYIEHIDNSGYTSNFSDVLLILSDYVIRNSYENSHGFNKRPTSLVKNHALQTLMIPPEHVKRIKPILSAIRDIRI